MFRRYTLHFVALLIAAVVAFAACGDGDTDASGDPTPTPPSVAPSPTPPTSEPETGPTGIASIDRVIAALEAGDEEAFVALLLLEPEACEPPAMGAGGPPQCQDGEATGTLVDVLPLASCEGAWVREDVLHQALAPLFQSEARIYGVYASDQRLFDRQGEFAVIVELSAQGPLAANVLMTDDGVVAVNFGCGHSAEQLVALEGIGDPIFEPDDQTGGPGEQPAATCVEGATDVACDLAERLGDAASDSDGAAFRALVDAAEPESITCEGNGEPFEATFLCEGATAGEVREGFQIAQHGSEGGYVTPNALKDMLSNYVRDGAELASTGCAIDGCDTFLVAFALGPAEPRTFYIAFERDAGAREYTLVGAGVSGDNAGDILQGGRTFTVAGEATFEAWSGDDSAG